MQIVNNLQLVGKPETQFLDGPDPLDGKFLNNFLDWLHRHLLELQLHIGHKLVEFGHFGVVHLLQGVDC